MLIVLFVLDYAECTYSECTYSECHCAKYRYAECQFGYCRGALTMPNFKFKKKPLFTGQRLKLFLCGVNPNVSGVIHVIIA
jgi:hypothetical protein